MIGREAPAVWFPWPDSFPDPERRAGALSAALERDPGSVAVFEGDVKGIWSGDGFEVYDLAKDPQELRPITPDPGDSALTALRDLASSYHDPGATEQSRELSDAVRKELEALGYL